MSNLRTWIFRIKLTGTGQSGTAVVIDRKRGQSRREDELN